MGTAVSNWKAIKAEHSHVRRVWYLSVRLGLDVRSGLFGFEMRSLFVSFEVSSGLLGGARCFRLNAGLDLRSRLFGFEVGSGLLRGVS